MSADSHEFMENAPGHKPQLAPLAIRGQRIPSRGVFPRTRIEGLHEDVGINQEHSVFLHRPVQGVPVGQRRSAPRREPLELPKDRVRDDERGSHMQSHAHDVHFVNERGGAVAGRPLIVILLLAGQAQLTR